MSSQYVVLENRPLDQWKVTELKEELKKRKLITKGLKDDLVKRLDEAIRAELEKTNQNLDNGVSDIHQPDDPTLDPIVSDNITTLMDHDTSVKNESSEKDILTEKLDITESLEKDNMVQNQDDENKDRVDGNQVVEDVSVKTVESQTVEINKTDVQESKPELTTPSDINNQVVEVSKVKSDCISIDTTMSVTEKIELKNNVIADDDVKLELDGKPEISFKPESVVVDDIVTTEEKDVSIAVESINTFKTDDSGDVGSPEKLNLDRSSGDDSMEDDTLDIKQVDSISEITNASMVKDSEPVDVMVERTPALKITESTKDENDPAVGSMKRKIHDQEAVQNNEVVKRQRRWNNFQQQTTDSSVPTDNTFPASMRHRILKSDSSVNREEPKERVVPPSSKTPTTSLRIDRFLRPFTLKAVQQLLGKTGTIVSFWMDQIKTHCYVTFSSVEEAIETRNAVYNLRWPTNGGHLLIAEFVDPLEVKTRAEAHTVTTTAPQPPPTATKPPQQMQLPPPPPPPFSHPPPQSREPAAAVGVALPPPPPLPEKFEPPVVTLDDLFRKTRSTPRIYYLPLSEEQVAEKLKRTIGLD